MGVGVEFFSNVAGTILRDFCSTVAVKDCKKESVLIKSEIEKRIFHVFSPALVKKTPYLAFRWRML